MFSMLIFTVTNSGPLLHKLQMSHFRSQWLKVLVVNDILLEINTLIFTPTLNCKGGKFSDEKS